MSVQDLLVVTADGVGKRTGVDHYRQTGRARVGVRTTSPRGALVAALLVNDGDELVLATSAAKVERLAVAEVPRLGRATRGVRLIRLRAGERVTAATVAPQPPSGDGTPEDASVCASGVRFASSAAVSDHAVRPGRAALRPGEQFEAAVVLHPPAAPRPGGGRLAVEREAWAATEIHAASDYWCGHCGDQFAHPEDVYAHIDDVHTRVWRAA